MISRLLHFDWALLFFWIMATTWGWLLGELIIPGVTLFTAGVWVGIFQWLVLQGRVPRPWRWVIATSLGWLTGYLIAFFLFPQGFEGLIIGVTTGLAQWTVLRRSVSWAGWWIVFSVIGWVTGLTLLPGMLLTGTMAGLGTGICLEVLLRHPKPKPIPSGA